MTPIAQYHDYGFQWGAIYMEGIGRDCREPDLASDNQQREHLRPSSDVTFGLQRSMWTGNHGTARRKLERMRPYAT